MTAGKNLIRRRAFHQLALGGALCGLLGARAAAAPAADTAALGLANNTFGLGLLKQLQYHKPGENQLFSPFSLSSALLMTLEGARGRTAQEMGAVLGLPETLATSSSTQPWNLQPVRSQMKALMETSANQQAQPLQAQISQPDASIPQSAAYELRIANSVWVDDAFPLSADFAAVVGSAYQAAIRNVDFQGAPEEQRTLINDWVSQRTAQKIENLIPQGAIDALTRMVLANAIYFQGKWAHPFDSQRTKPHEFYLSEKVSQSVPMMAQLFEECRYAAFAADGSKFVTPRLAPSAGAAESGYPPDGFQAIELDYSGGDLTMLLLLPRQRTGLQALIELLTPDMLDNWVKELEPRKCFVQLPRLRLEASLNMQTLLRQLGMPTAFDPQTADFSGLGADDLYISDVLHKAFVDIDEQGTEAAAATAVVIGVRSAIVEQRPFVPQFVADHPYLFVIRDRRQGLTHFMGQVTDPS